MKRDPGRSGTAPTASHRRYCEVASLHCSGAGAATGNYAVRVESLASSQTVASGSAFTNSSELVGAGTLTSELGGWEDRPPLTFVPKAAAMMAVFWVSMSFMTSTLVAFFIDTIIPQIAGG